MSSGSGGLFDDWKAFFSGKDPRSSRRGDGAADQPSELEDDDDDDDDEYAAGETNVVTIPVREIKPGGLRLFLMLFLMGLQNTPTKGTWRADQPTSEDYVVDFWYHDNTGVLSVTLSEAHKKITIDRVGSNPSTGYMMQESVVIASILDELESMANDPDVAEKDRLLIPQTERTIAEIRETLAFG